MYNEAMLGSVAARFRAMGEPVRLRVLHALRAGEQTVSALVDRLDLGQANLSKHLAVLHREGLVDRRREGLNVFYRIADPSVFRLCDLMCGRVEAHAARQAKVLKAPRRRAS